MTVAVRSNFVTYGIVGAIMLYFVGWGDYASSYQINLSIFYYLPIALWAWYLGLGPAVIMSVASTCGWLANDYLTGNTYTHEYFRYWNAGVHLTAFFVLSVAVHLFRRHEEAEALRRTGLESSVEELEKYAATFRALRGQELEVCSNTHRVKVEGQWIDLRSFLKNHLGLNFCMSLSDDALREIVNRFNDYHEKHEAI